MIPPRVVVVVLVGPARHQLGWNRPENAREQHEADQSVLCCVCSHCRPSNATKPNQHRTDSGGAGGMVSTRGSKTTAKVSE